jgi:hypothetical protein
LAVFPDLAFADTARAGGLRIGITFASPLLLAMAPKLVPIARATVSKVSDEPADENAERFPSGPLEFRRCLRFCIRRFLYSSHQYQHQNDQQHVGNTASKITKSRIRNSISYPSSLR